MCGGGVSLVLKKGTPFVIFICFLVHGGFSERHLLCCMHMVAMIFSPFNAVAF